MNEELEIQNQEQVVEKPSDSASPQQLAPPESQADKNFAELRRQHHRALMEKEELQQRIARYEASRPKSEAPSEAADEELTIGDDDLPEGKHLKQVDKKSERRFKKQEAEIQALKKKVEEEFIENKIRARFPDFESIVNPESIRVLAEEDPELAYTIQSSPDGYNRAILAYKEIKKRGIVPNTSYDADKQRAKDNAAKPRPLVSAAPQQGDSPLSHANAFANGLTPELRKQLWKEMQDSIKNS